MLPNPIFNAITKGDDAQSIEVARLRTIRLTISKFDNAIASAGYKTLHYQPYLSRPSFALRYKLPVIRAHLLGHLPLLKEVFVTAAYYLIAKK